MRQILVKNGTHIGTQRKVEAMRRFIFKIREDGLAIINTQETIDRIKAAAQMLAKYRPDEVLVVTSREQAERAVKKFAEAVGARALVGRFMPGTMTNPDLEYFIEPRVLLASDPYGDRQAITEAFQQGVPVISLASTNNLLNKVDLVVPCNNKGRRALAAVYWVLANQVLYERGELKADETIDTPLEEFVAKPAK